VNRKPQVMARPRLAARRIEAAVVNQLLVLLKSLEVVMATWRASTRLGYREQILGESYRFTFRKSSSCSLTSALELPSTTSSASIRLILLRKNADANLP
jgi:hypothetical protein